MYDGLKVCYTACHDKQTRWYIGRVYCQVKSIHRSALSRFFFIFPTFRGCVRLVDVCVTKKRYVKGKIIYKREL